MGLKPKTKQFQPLAKTVASLLDPVLQKKTGLSLELIENWPHLVGEHIAHSTMPLKIIWPRRISVDDPFKPATLVVGCEGYAAMILAHENIEILQRINAFFGYVAISRIKIEQCVVEQDAVKPNVRAVIDETDRKVVGELTRQIENEELRNSLYNLGLAIFAQK
ncbi:DciA family protein [uncultured Bartonella sp.]|uniref:DUF721 domain-containing protein n=1 Tax=uncultured Bartonella sp. TaxID=104108 RepID=UPI002603E70D|nr:DciA family protein [uncultured Bartonella sp.]